jgi:hypothetical protein
MRIVRSSVIGLFVLLLAAFGAAARAPVAAGTDLSGVDDFDFQLGEWRVEHRVLKIQPDGSEDWVRFTGTSSNRQLMAGLMNVEDNLFHTAQGDRRGVAMRSYDRSNGSWAIWWVDERYPHAALDPPVVGRFTDGVGTFVSESLVDGKPVRTRFTWSHITPTSARWEQAASHDGGASWKTNWTMQFTRQGLAPRDAN